MEHKQASRTCEFQTSPSIDFLGAMPIRVISSSIGQNSNVKDKLSKHPNNKVDNTILSSSYIYLEREPS